MKHASPTPWLRTWLLPLFVVTSLVVLQQELVEVIGPNRGRGQAHAEPPPRKKDTGAPLPTGSMPDAPTGDAPRKPLTILHTINNVGYIEPCG